MPAIQRDPEILHACRSFRFVMKEASAPSADKISGVFGEPSVAYYAQPVLSPAADTAVSEKLSSPCRNHRIGVAPVGGIAEETHQDLPEVPVGTEVLVRSFFTRFTHQGVHHGMGEFMGNGRTKVFFAHPVDDLTVKSQGDLDGHASFSRADRKESGPESLQIETEGTGGSVRKIQLQSHPFPDDFFHPTEFFLEKRMGGTGKRIPAFH